ncbi:MAG TPA: PQQ-dependent sugar dehydrogenase, partial [Cellvibrio sp.]
MQTCVRKIIFITGCLILVACGGGGGGSGGNPSVPSSVSVSSLVAMSSSLISSSIAPSSLASSSMVSTVSSAQASSVTASTSSAAFGIATRPSNKTCLAPVPVTSGATTISWSAVFPSLPNISQATNLIQAPDDNANWYALRQYGIVVRFPNQVSANALTSVLNIEDRVEFNGGETGLLGIAFHPQFATNRYVYFYYMGLNASDDLESRVARYQFAANGTIDKNSELILLRFDQPYSNHNGGQLAFGNDGFLYIASGDGGSGGDPQQNGQNKNNLLGKILRIDVDNPTNGKNYGIPADNPFASSGGSPEIWAYGLRNPWRFSFDSETGDLWAGDVGQGAWEEINIVTNGGNYGWGDMEGD